MKVIKYWQVLLFRISQPSSIINERKPIETLVFGGYSKEKPNIKLGTGLSIELFTAPDSLETQIIRDHLIDIVRCFPVCEDDGDEKDGVPEKIHDHSCVNCFADKGQCLVECHVSDVNKARSSSFEDVVKPVIKWLNENTNPHTSVNIDATSAQLLTGEIGIHTEEFIKD
ncbi:hypothetical protein [Klebsiella grimontii]|uniref:hypothetical protein n=1 Tax=Klebsiella grimontii TaxID=2058152 RepID=UPI0020C24281|nr:hypothetical protein [Klebsiella grimontii]UTJ44310.1 hypothetical protein NLZ17_10260 [Klebsiella grimontii]